MSKCAWKSSVVVGLCILAGTFTRKAEGASLSTGLRFSVTDLNDFIAPEEKCILPMQGGISSKPPPGSVAAPMLPRSQPRRRKKKKASDAMPGQANSSLPSNGTALRKRRTRTRKSKASDIVATVTLSDCLACSGCVTSSEEILLDKHSAGVLFNASSDPNKYCVVSLSPQACASIAAAHNLTLQETTEKLCGFLKSIGVKRVFSTDLGADLAVLEACEEFVERWHVAKGTRNASCGNVPPVRPLPVLCTECPGFVLFGEKKYADDLLPLFSKVKSPQAISGTLLKRVFERKLLSTALSGMEARSASLWHCAVMPCLDKKLESAREELTVAAHPRGESEEGAATRQARSETDCVLTTQELASLLQAHSPTPLDQLPASPLDSFRALLTSSLATAAAPHSSSPSAPPPSLPLDRSLPQFSNGYLEAVARYAALHILGVRLPGRLTMHLPRGGTTDLRELTVHGPGGDTLRFAIVYGFRHIQNLVSSIQRRTCPYDYVEIMSCPSGCTNGGAQLMGQSLDFVNSRFAHGLAARQVDTVAAVKRAIVAERLSQRNRADGAASASPVHCVSELLRTSFRSRPMSLAAQLEEW